MAEILLSPGVLSREIDATFIAEQPPQIGAAIIGPTVKGPVGVPVTVTSYTDFVNRFGEIEVVAGTGSFSYFTSITAYNYFQNGGETLLVTRVVSGTYAAATASVSGSVGVAFTLTTISEGANMNTGTDVDSNGAFATTNGSASIHSVRFQIVSPNTASGTFNLYVRRGDDDNRNPGILETYTGLSMDPLSENYVARRIGDYKFTQVTLDGEASLQITGTYPNKSRYIRVDQVLKPTPQYLVGGVANSAYTASIPTTTGANSTGSFTGGAGALIAGAKFYENATGSNIQGVNVNNYSNAIQLLASANDYQFNVLVTPGLNFGDTNHKVSMSVALANTENRGDSVYVMDLAPYSSSASEVIATANTVDSSYGAAYYPWVQTLDPATKQYVNVPASVMIPGVFAYNDSVAEPWFAPAGISRGGLSTVIRAASKLSQGVRDSLYVGKVNPLATFPGQGVVVYGNKTLQTAASALDRINVRRLMIALKGYIGQIANGLVFQQNNASTRNSFLAQVNPYLESVQQRQGLYAFKVVMDDSINNAAVIDRNELVGQIYLQPTKTAEFIYLNFTLTPTGAVFP